MYNRVGERIGKRDKNGTVHEYEYDNLGRLLHDRATTLAADISTGIRRISTAYDVVGNVQKITSHNNATVGSGTEVNQVVYEYDANGLLAIVSEGLQSVAHNPLLNPPASAGGGLAPMRHISFFAVILLLFVGCSRAVESYSVIELDHGDEVFFAVFSPDSKTIVTAGGDNTARIWDVDSGSANFGKELQKLEGHRAAVRSATFSPDSKKIVTASYDCTARIWDADTGKELQKVGEYTEPVTFATFSPDGKTIVTAGGDNTARIWNVDSGSANFGKELQKLIGHGIVETANFSPDGKKIVTAGRDGSARIWDVESGNELRRLESRNSFGAFFSSQLDKRSNALTSALFSPDGKQVVSASYDRTIRIWDADTGKELQKLGEHEYGVRSAAFSPDGKKIVSAGGTDDTARIWTLEQ